MFIRIIQLLLVSGSLCLASESPERIALFNGKDLEGWDGSVDWWSVEDGAPMKVQFKNLFFTPTTPIFHSSGKPEK
jgi:hypothetical protein